MGITQPTFSQYVNCVIPLNTDAVLKFADLLRVPPTEIDPSLKNVMTLKPVKHVRERHIPLIGSTSGRGILKYASVKVTNIQDQGVFAGIVVDDNSLLSAGVSKGAVIVVDLDADPYVRKRNVMLRERGSDSFVFAEYMSSTSNAVTLIDPVADKMLRFRLSRIAQMHLVYTIAPAAQ